MSRRKPTSDLGFVCILALLMSLGAYSIDATLPALGIIGQEFAVFNKNHPQLIISAIFIGLSFGQLFYGPLSDSIGRRKGIFLGFIVFFLGCFLSVVSQSLGVMLVGRVLQGFGAAGPRIITMALVRDKFKGDSMARIMSFVSAVFVVVPTLAPTAGQLILNNFHWRAIFISQVLLGVISLTVFYIFQPETLAPERRKKFNVTQFILSAKICFKNSNTICYALATGFVFAAFLGYLNSAQQIYIDYFKLGDRLPVFFGILAFSIGSASLLNSQLVLRFGMRRLTWTGIIIFTLVACNYLLLMWLSPEMISLQTFMCSMFVIFFCHGILFGNLNSLALEPHGDIAGAASAVVGTIQSLISVFLGVGIGQMYNGSLWPMMLGFVIMGLLTILVLSFTKKI